MIKDHKSREDNGFPLRPIASVIGTAIEKLDWLLRTVLGQLADLVPANLKNSLELISTLEGLDKSSLTHKHCFISLDVTQLYPSIPIDFGIEAVTDFAQENWSTICT